MSAISSIREQINPTNEDQRQQREQLDFLLVAAKAKLQGYKSDLENMFLNPDAVGAIQIIGKRALFYQEQYMANIKENASQNIGDAVDSFFTGTSDGIKSGFKNIIGLAFNSILGNTTSGEQEEQQFFVTSEHNAIIRVDVKIWRYNFGDKSFITKVENAICYIFCKSIVDHTKITPDEYLYLLSQQLSDNLDAVTNYIKQLRQAWNAIEGLGPNEVQAKYITASKAQTTAHLAPTANPTQL